MSLLVVTPEQYRDGYVVLADDFLGELPSGHLVEALHAATEDEIRIERRDFKLIRRLSNGNYVVEALGC